MSETVFWRLDSTTQTLVFASCCNNIPECSYWGGSLPLNENLAALYSSQQRPITGATLDEPVPLSLCPEESLGFIGRPGLLLSTLDGQRLLPHFQLAQARQTEHQLEFILADSFLGLQLTQTLALSPQSDTLSARAAVQCIDFAKPVVRVDWLSAPV